MPMWILLLLLLLLLLLIFDAKVDDLENDKTLLRLDAERFKKDAQKVLKIAAVSYCTSMAL
jgi:hypothetical protein